MVSIHVIRSDLHPASFWRPQIRRFSSVHPIDIFIEKFFHFPITKKLKRKKSFGKNDPCRPPIAVSLFGDPTHSAGPDGYKIQFGYSKKQPDGALGSMPRKASRHKIVWASSNYKEVQNREIAPSRRDRRLEGGRMENA